MLQGRCAWRRVTHVRDGERCGHGRVGGLCVCVCMLVSDWCVVGRAAVRVTCRSNGSGGGYQQQSSVVNNSGVGSDGSGRGVIHEYRAIVFCSVLLT